MTAKLLYKHCVVTFFHLRLVLSCAYLTSLSPSNAIVAKISREITDFKEKVIIIKVTS